MKPKNKINQIVPRLSDEDPDPIEKDEAERESLGLLAIEGWHKWDPEDIADVKNFIAKQMSEKQRFVLQAFLQGLSYNDIGVTEKYWRYHFINGIELIKKGLRL